LIDMFFPSKLLATFIQPLTWAAVLILLALWWLPSRPVAALWTLLLAVSLTALVGWMPLPNAVLRSLESQYAAPTGSLTPYVGLVVLGGDIDLPRNANDSRAFVLSHGGHRMTTSVALSRQYPDLKLLFTGGQSDIIDRNISVADAAQAYYTSMNIPPERTLYERAARTTYENAILSPSVPGVEKTQPWLLLTSASHMPRSMALFRAAGWNVTPYPVGFSASDHLPWTDYSMAQGAVRWRIVLHEVLGLAAFKALGLAH
jgi:uncharacterized SAM-binding protein YcdF (DUF218 family)